MQLKNLRAILRAKGYSLTSPRRLVFENLLGSEPKSLADIINSLAAQVDRASVYRTTALFEELGILHRINTGWKFKLELSDTFLGHHHHLHCSACGRSLRLDHNPMLETIIDSLVAKQGFRPRSHQLEIYGLCEACQSAVPASRRS